MSRWLLIIQKALFILTLLRNIGPDQINLQVFFAYFEKSVGAIEFCLLVRGCGFVKPHPQKTTFNLERKTIWKAARRNHSIAYKRLY